MKRQTRPLTERQQYWLQHLRACDASGQSMKAYAQAQNLAIHDLYSWKKTLVKRGVLPRTRTARFQRVETAAAVASHWQVQLPNGVAISFAAAVDAGTLATVLNTAATLK